MLVLFLTSALVLLTSVYSVFLWPLSVFMLMFFYFNLSNFFFCSSVSFLQESIVGDSLGFFMTFLLFVIMYISYLVSINFKSFRLMALVMFFLSVACYNVFTSSNMFYLYFFFEASLVPIFYIIIKWGSYPERSSSAMMMMIYTLFFGAPMLVLIISFMDFSGSWLMIMSSVYNSSSLISIFIFLCFCVKLPIYGLHYWLPMAHVEAPTFGSVILASVLLKLGGVGLVRFSEFLSLSSMKSFSLSYFVVFIIFSSVVCCYQSDMKRLIAYSSVAHMMVVPFMVLSSNILSSQSLVLIMFFHGLSSTLLFMLVGSLYEMFSSRQLVLMRGVMLISPLLSLLSVFSFLFSMSAPPFPSFMSEVFFFLSSFGLTPYMMIVIILFSFLGLLYNLNWLSSVLFFSSVDMCFTSSNMKFSSFLCFFSVLVFMVVFSILFMMV